jgi:hypothetical protein
MLPNKKVLLVLGIVVVLLWGCAPVDGPAGAEGEADLTPEAIPMPSEAPPAGAAPAPKPALMPAVPDTLRARAAAAIRNVRQRDLSTTNAFWTIFHGILGLGPGVQVVDRQTKLRAKALDHICEGGELRGLRYRISPVGVEVVTLKDGQGQGHQDQMIAEMAQWSMPADRKWTVHGRDFTFMDFVRHSQLHARLTTNQELSWTIIIVAQYLGTDVSWTNLFNEKLTFADVVRYELEQPVETAACGGTHRLFGLSWAHHLHLLKGGKTQGVWKAIPEKTAHYRDLAKRWQNPDGSFSTNFFRSRGHDQDKNLRINSTGHILEWLALALSDAELHEQWVQDAVNAVSLQILDLQGAPIDSGSMYHAVHGLQIYYARVFDRSFCPPELLIPLPPGWKKP